MTEVSDKELIQVRNLVDHTVGFKDEDTRRRIIFQPYEMKKVPAEILRRLFFSHGGAVMLRNYLNVNNKSLAAEFGVSSDTIEYDWTEKDVQKVLQEGSLDELEDALDFGPEGIKDLIVSKAVELKIDNVSKRQAIKEHTGSDITTMIQLKEDFEGDKEESNNQPKTRRTAIKQETPQRRVTQEQE